MHFTASALVVHPDSGRVLLRWHQRMRMWLQVGGHGDPGEGDPLAIALREAREETGLPDLRPWPDDAIRHAVLCVSPRATASPRTSTPTCGTSWRRSARRTRPESPARRCAGSPWTRRARITSEPNLRETLTRVQRLMASR